jgi:DNA-binding CsgD family transcriptional regulator
MVAQNASGQVHFDVGVEIDPEIIHTYEALGTSDPRQSPRSNAALHTKPLHSFCESDFITPEERLRHPMYQEVHLHFNAAYVCGGMLSSHNDLLVGLGVLRSDRQGHTSGEERRAFEALLPHLDASFRLQMLIEANAAAIAIGSYDKINLPVAFCDHMCRVIAMSHPAEALLRGNRFIEIRQGRLAARVSACQAALDDAFALATMGAGRPHTKTGINKVPLLDIDGNVVAEAEVTSLPRNGLFGLGEIMVVFKQSPYNERALGLSARTLLTPAEAKVAILAASGASVERIARRRGTSPATVRSQLKAVYSKLDVRSRVELALRFHA